MTHLQPKATLPIILVAVSILVNCARGENWPRFRGPTGQGISSEDKAPTRFSNTENVAWKTPIPGDGWSSPIVWNDRVFLTCTTDNGKTCRVLALNRSNGEIVWNTEVLTQETRRKEGKNSYATPTPVTDGRMVHAVFGGGGIAAVRSQDGEPVWTYDKVKFYSQHGLGASPILHENLVIMPFDGSSPGPDTKVGWKIPWDQARILALNKSTGDVVWEANRGKSRIAHTTPIVAGRGATTQLISTAGDAIQGFTLTNGKLVWTAYSQGEGVVPSPVLVDDLAITCSGFEAPTIRAVRLGGKGEVTQSHIAWEQTKGVPSQSSPIYVAPHLFTVTDNGVVSKFDVKDGKLLDQRRIGGNHSASPIYAARHLYFLSEQGDVTIVEPESLEVIATNPIGERCQASLAISDGQILIRGERTLYCVGQAE
jgi:outer membrane protein assembly factor BamB